MLADVVRIQGVQIKVCGGWVHGQDIVEHALGQILGEVDGVNQPIGQALACDVTPVSVDIAVVGKGVHHRAGTAGCTKKPWLASRRAVVL